MKVSTSDTMGGWRLREKRVCIGLYWFKIPKSVLFVQPKENNCGYGRVNNATNWESNRMKSLRSWMGSKSRARTQTHIANTNLMRPHFAGAALLLELFLVPRYTPECLKN